MHRPLAPLALLLALAGLAPAQATNAFANYPNAAATTLTSRYQAAAPAQGELEVLHRHEAAAFAWLGDGKLGGGEATLTGYRRIAQDENASTQERWHFVVRRDAAGQPDASAAGLLHKSVAALTPPGTGQQAWLLTLSFAPLTIPTTADLYFGVEMERVPSAAWPSDGQSSHCSAYVPQTGYVEHGNVRPQAPNHAWGIVHGTPNTASQPSARMLDQALLTAAPVLQPGGFDKHNAGWVPNGTNLGEGGIRPDVADLSARTSPAPRFDDLRLVVRDQASAFCALYLDVARGPGFGLPGIHGTLGLSAGLIFLAAAPLSGGAASIDIPLGPGPNALRTGLKGQRLHWQALCFPADLKRLAFSNVATHIL